MHGDDGARNVESVNEVDRALGGEGLLGRCDASDPVDRVPLTALVSSADERSSREPDEPRVQRG